MASAGDKLPSEDKAAVEAAIEALKSATASGDLAGITRAMDQLTQVQHKAAEALYKNAGPAGAQGAPGSAGPGAPGSTGSAGSPGSAGAGDVIDAEVVDDK